MDNRRNYYRILHVQRDAPLEIIKTSYRTLMQRMKMHPDLGGDHDDAQLINVAYATLSDPARRADYDAGLNASFDEMRAARQSREAEQKAADTARRAKRQRPRDAGGQPQCAYCDTPIPPRAAEEGMSCAGCDSPLRAAAAHNPAPAAAERAIERMPRKLPALIQLRPGNSEVYEAEVMDLSPRGVRVRATVTVPIGATIRIQCGVCRGVGRVRSCGRDTADLLHQRQIGIEFITVEFRAQAGSFVSVEA
ncbi:MAG: J domain-containing protein [Gammaproteobacteria bacterium]|nr:J domain-containing protein [Gammaproteobacteria bacterium]